MRSLWKLSVPSGSTLKLVRRVTACSSRTRNPQPHDARKTLVRSRPYPNRPASARPSSPASALGSRGSARPFALRVGRREGPTRWADCQRASLNFAADQPDISRRGVVLFAVELAAGPGWGPSAVSFPGSRRCRRILIGAVGEFDVNLSDKLRISIAVHWHRNPRPRREESDRCSARLRWRLRRPSRLA